MVTSVYPPKYHGYEQVQSAQMHEIGPWTWAAPTYIGTTETRFPFVQGVPQRQAGNLPAGITSIRNIYTRYQKGFLEMLLQSITSDVPGANRQYPPKFIGSANWTGTGQPVLSAQSLPAVSTLTSRARGVLHAAAPNFF